MKKPNELTQEDLVYIQDFFQNNFRDSKVYNMDRHDRVDKMTLLWYTSVYDFIQMSKTTKYAHIKRYDDKKALAELIHDCIFEHTGESYSEVLCKKLAELKLSEISNQGSDNTNDGK